MKSISAQALTPSKSAPVQREKLHAYQQKLPIEIIGLSPEVSGDPLEILINKEESRLAELN